MPNTANQNICPKCQAPIPSDAPAGLCPKCVLAEVKSSTTHPADGANTVPSVEQLAPVFPQLEITELIGRGGMGFVLKARQRHLDREVALKLLPEKLGTDPHFAERFTREARVLAKLNHPNIVMVHDFGHTGGYYYLVMEYVEGMNLRQAMRMGKFSPGEALSIVPKICDALQFAHEQGVLHRDIKPENILLDARGRVKIADFGIAKIVGEEKGPLTLTGTGASLGTPHYMAPEQFENPAQVDHRADIYSLGVVFYEMLTGELPLGRFAAPSARADLDERIDSIVLRALARERELRQKDARELQTEVETVATSAPVHRTASARGEAPSFPRRLWTHRWQIATASVILFSLFFAFANWKSRIELERLFAEQQSVTPTDAPSGGTLNIPASQPVHQRHPSGNPVPDLAESPIPASPQTVDEKTRRRQDEAIEEASRRFQEAQARHSRGEISDRDLALANRDLVIAEARGDAVKTAAAEYQFVQWEFTQLRNTGAKRHFGAGADINPEFETKMYRAEVELIKAQHRLSLAKAGTNQLQIAGAELKLAEMMLGAAERVRGRQVLSDEEIKKFENERLYADLKYKRLKQAESGN